jgi:glycosyltransferase involved in cell wall biosynthesis
MGLNIAAIGRVLPHKGFETIIAALRPSDSLHILGPLEHEDPYYKYLMNERTMGSVTFHGPVSEKTKGTFLQECDVLVSASTTSLYDGRTIEQSELLGIVLFEAVAQGKIPFVSNQPAFVEVMELFDGLQYVFPQNDAAALRSLFDKYEQLSADELMDTTRDMQQRLRKKGCFDNYWRRIIKRLDGAC